MTSTQADQLQTAVDELNDQLRAVAKALTGVQDAQLRQRRVSAAAIVIGVLVALVLALVLADNHRAIVANNKLLCPIIRVFSSNDPPRTTAAGRQMQAEGMRLLDSPAYDC